ncbi:Hypothetical Protein FCC1311_111592 [Hondaea fermentalgiana]|uniref:Uncharacterized protein n=1 Tax=Hondaea fermentalgiana TaxID=2315210 RepID=A0A2R5GVR8_9STRA|nr:Hypothetical Protein FCC1311_111592 [Hondaea fermentalgiana]|eukprot:GBG34936.1 Hypothetical Protein FCC1311_111592 [Hondaea fermentalgiana]
MASSQDTNNVWARLEQAQENGDISKEELEAGMEYYVLESEISKCEGCASGEHQNEREARLQNMTTGIEKVLENLDAYWKELSALNARIKKFGITRDGLCYLDASDVEFAKVRAYNVLCDNVETTKALQALRCGFPFVMDDSDELTHMSLEQRQVAAVASLYAEYVDVRENKDDQRPTGEAEVDRMLAMVTLACKNERDIDVRAIQAMLPADLRIPKKQVSEVDMAIRKALKTAQEVGDLANSTKSDTELALTLAQGRQAERKKRALTRARSITGVLDRNGERWRVRDAADGSAHWECFSMEIGALPKGCQSGGMVSVPVPRVKRSVSDSGFFPDVDLDNN